MSPMVGRPRWTPEEDDRIRMLALLSGASLGSIAKEMRRSTSAIRHRALKLKIVLARLPKMGLKAEGKSHWTLREERRLLEFAAARMPLEDASEKTKALGRVDSHKELANGDFARRVRECRAKGEGEIGDALSDGISALVDGGRSRLGGARIYWFCI